MSERTGSPETVGQSDEILTVRSIRKEFPDGRGSVKVAIDDVDFNVRAGEFICVVGQSGAGKTTLLRCLSGLMEPTRGQVLFEGRPVTGVPERLSVVFQDYSRSLFPWSSVEKNIDLPLRVHGVPKAQRKARVGELLAAVGLPGTERRYPWQLSGGMQQRVAIARALAHRPDLLLMDEPFASVDAQTRFELEDMTLELREKFGVTVVLVTHDIDEAVYLADRIVVLSAAPSRVEEVVEVDLPRPRDQVTTRNDARFAGLRTRLLQLVTNR